MPDPTPTPTPTPDAGPLHDLLCAYDLWLNGEDSDDTIRWHATEFLRSAVSAEHRAALAASPAPTDSPDERECERCRHAWTEHHAEQGCLHDRSSDAFWRICGCRHARPAAVTAPREDERAVQPFTVGDGWEGSFDAEGTLTLSFGSDVGPQGEYVLDQPEVEHLRGFLAAVAPAVERATPDPDTLAELLREHLRPIHVAGIPDRVDDLAHALTAAGVTYTPRGPAARVEELHRERLRYQLGAGNEAGVTITPPTTGQGHTAP